MPRSAFWLHPPSRPTATAEDALSLHLGELLEEGVVVLEWGFAPFGQPCFTRYPTSAANPPRICHSPLDRPTLTDYRRLYATLSPPRAAPVGAHVPWTTWGRFAHNSPRARVKVHSPRVLESRSAGQRALAPPTDGHPPDYRTIQTLHNHFPCHPPTAFQPRYGRNQPPRNHEPIGFHAWPL